MSHPFGDQKAVRWPSLVVSMDELALVTASGTFGRWVRVSEELLTCDPTYREEPDSTNRRDIRPDHSAFKSHSRDPILGKLCHPNTASGRRKLLPITGRVPIDNRTPRIRIRLDVAICIVGST